MEGGEKRRRRQQHWADRKHHFPVLNHARQVVSGDLSLPYSPGAKVQELVAIIGCLGIQTSYAVLGPVLTDHRQHVT